MSFFDEPEETRTEPRTARRRRRPSGGGRRSRPATRQTILIRQIVLVVGVVLAIVLIALLVSSCETSARNRALKDYNNSVASLNAQSVNTGANFFRALSGPTSDPAALQNNLSQSAADGSSQLSKGKGINTPDEVKGAQQDFVRALQMRADGMRSIAQQIQPALNSQSGKQAVSALATDMARFYASDVLYIDYSVPQIIGALRAAGISVGGLGGQQVNSSQFLPSIDWLNPTNVARELHVSLPSPPHAAKVAPGVHGHAMQSVSVGGTALSTSGTNTIPASPAPTFTCVFTNDGANTETNVVVKVAVVGAGVSGQAVVPQTVPGHQYTAQVALSSSPPKGSYTVTATVEKVPGESVTTHNTQTFQVTFQ
ncbi:MAG: hypothetical protein JO286_25340 [Solirubrobacterales bacterium]|nr:hypothetical protein [Solirubrobacterales bacterium]MBV9365526.1 hypothetical protein [Solirubrobacterales bacterium]MBV9810527.1 hypothetical protein [Solirubrobacterales bacterium]